LGDLKAEFDALCAEAETRRRMMSVRAHDRIAGRASEIRHERLLMMFHGKTRIVPF